MLDLLRPWPGASVLDVGGGHGQVTGPLVDAGYAVTVLGSEPACESARPGMDRHGPRALRRRRPAALPGFADRSYDVVLSLRLLPHVRRVAELVATLARLARAAVVVDYPTRRSVNAVSGPFFGLKQGVEGDTRPVHGVLRPRDRGRVRGARLLPHGCAVPSSSRRWRSTAPWARPRSRGRSRARRGARPHLRARLPRRAEARAAWLSPPRARLGARAVPPLGAQAAQARRARPRAGPDARACAASTSAPTTASSACCCASAAAPGRRADLTAEAVASIRSLVGDDVHLVAGDRLPFPDAAFDRVVVVDMLEHVADEAAFARELARVTKPGGRLVVNTPHLKRTLLRRARHALGQTDEKHGHLRPGYTPERPRELLAPAFELREPPHLLALLLGGGRHRPQLGHRAPRQEVLGQGHGGDGRRPRPPPQGLPELRPDLPARLGREPASTRWCRPRATC